MLTSSPAMGTRLSHQPYTLPILPCTDSIWQVWLARLLAKCGTNAAHPHKWQYLKATPLSISEIGTNPESSADYESDCDTSPYSLILSEESLSLGLLEAVKMRTEILRNISTSPLKLEHVSAEHKEHIMHTILWES